MYLRQWTHFFTEGEMVHILQSLSFTTVVYVKGKPGWLMLILLALGRQKQEDRVQGQFGIHYKR